MVEGKKEFYTIYDNLDISIRRYIESLVDLGDKSKFVIGFYVGKM